MYDVISKNMLNMFATIVEFNNFIGTPINTYKIGYSRLKFFRKIFFDKVQNSPDLDKYVGIYKWIDDALDSILFNLLPASANASEKVRTVIENHILERNKIYYPLTPDESIVVIGGQKMIQVNDVYSIGQGQTNRKKEVVEERTGTYSKTTTGYIAPQGPFTNTYEKDLTPLRSNNTKTPRQQGTSATRLGRK